MVRLLRFVDEYDQRNEEEMVQLHTELANKRLYSGMR